MTTVSEMRRLFQQNKGATIAYLSVAAVVFALTAIGYLPARDFYRRFIGDVNPLLAISGCILLVCLLLGFGNGLGSGINMTLGADYAPRERSGEFIGVWRMAGDIGTTTSPPIIGAVAQVASLGLSSVLTGGIGVVGLLLMLFGVRETLERRNRA